MPPALTIDLANALAGEVRDRGEAARRLAAHLGVPDLLVFIKEPGVDAHLPPLGFSQTLPGGRFWRSFVQTCIDNGAAEGELFYPTLSDRRTARGWAAPDETVLILLDGDPRPGAVAEVLPLLPLLGAVFRRERLAFTAAGQTQVAVDSAAQATELASALDSVRAELQAALAAKEQHIAERQKVEAELARSNEALRQFAHTAAHDMQEPLRTVANYAGLLSLRYRAELSGDGQEFIDFITSGARRMHQLIRALLSYAQASADPVLEELVDSEAILKSAQTNLLAAIEETAAIITHDELPPVHCDPTQLLQLFQNLLGNALKYRSEQPPRIHVTARVQGREVLFSIGDNGIGIAPQYHESIFALFKRLHGEEYEGAGLGLASCKRIVERHGGRIWVDSQPGLGSTFHFTLAASPQSTAAVSRSSASPQ